MAKTVPQLKKIDRSDPEKVEQIVTPYEWQKKPQPARDAGEINIKTVPVARPGSKRSR